MEDRIVTLVQKLPWKTGKYPHATIGLDYRTRQLIFLDETTGETLRLNVQSRRLKSMEFDKLSVGEKIKGFTVLRLQPNIIDPESDCIKHHPGALF